MLKNRKEIECYKEVMESRPIYLKIWWYYFVQRYKQKGSFIYNWSQKR